jgi:hypothetical protein
MLWSVGYIIYCETAHFLLGCSVGLLAYCLISTIYPNTSQASRSKRSYLHGLLSNTDLCILCFCLSLALASHVVEDIYLSWF